MVETATGTGPTGKSSGLVTVKTLRSDADEKARSVLSAVYPRCWQGRKIAVGNMYALHVSTIEQKDTDYSTTHWCCTDTIFTSVFEVLDLHQEVSIETHLRVSCW